MKHFLLLTVMLAGAVTAQYELNPENNDAASGSDLIVRIPLTKINVNLNNDDKPASTPIPEFTTLPTKSLSRAKRGFVHQIFGGNKQHAIDDEKRRGRINLHNLDDKAYAADISIGTPPQKFRMHINTAAADTWVPSSDCIAEGFEYHRKFEAKKSSSFKYNMSDNFHIGYDDGGVTVRPGQDNVAIAGLQIKNQVFGQAVKMDPIYKEQRFDGSLGLAFRKISILRAPTIMDNMITQNLIKQHVFSMRLNHVDDKTGGELFIGGIDKNSFVPPLDYIPISKIGYWQIHLDKITIEASPLKKIQICPNGCEAILNPGTSSIVAPSKLVDALNHIMQAKLMDGTNYYILECSRLAHMPNIIITIQEKPYVLTPNDYIVKHYYKREVTCYSGFEKSASGTDDVFTLGDPFLRVYYTVFDMKKKGLALLNQRQR